MANSLIEYNRFLTVTLKKKHYTDGALKQFNDTIYRLLYTFDVSGIEEYHVYPECTRDGNIHYHCLYNVEDKLLWLKNYKDNLKKHFGFYKDEYIQNYLNTLEYCKKDKQLMQDIVNQDLPITRRWFEDKAILPTSGAGAEKLL